MIKTTSAAETQDFGAQLAKRLSPGVVVCLYGDLGAGKTTLVQGIAKGLRIKKRLISPTFILARKYLLKAKGLRLKAKYLWHIDLYRLQNISEAKAIGIEELLADQTSILLIEWPEKIESMLPKNRWNIRLEMVGENKRRIIYEALH